LEFLRAGSDTLWAGWGCCRQGEGYHVLTYQYKLR
jgi:hypothetical protein